MSKLIWILIFILIILVAILISRASTGGVFGGIDNPFKAIKDKVNKWRDDRAARAPVESKENVSKGFNIFNKIFNTFSDVTAKFMLREYCSTGRCDLDRMFKEKCSTSAKDPEWAGSLFCALGEGNELASLIFRLRFAVPDSPEKHVLHGFINETSKNLTGVPIADEQLHEFVKTIFAKINRRELLTWADLPAYAILATKFPILKDRYLEPALNNFGFSVKKDADARVGVQQKGSLNDLVVEKCGKMVDGKYTGPWQNTLFCSLASSDRDHYIAEMLGRLHFTVPAEPNGHIISRIAEIVRKGLQTPPEGSSKQSWTNWGYEKAFNAQIGGLLTKIQSGTKITWDDLNALVSFSLMGLKNFDLLWMVEPFVIPMAVDKGLDIATTN